MTDHLIQCNHFNFLAAPIASLNYPGFEWSLTSSDRAHKQVQQVEMAIAKVAMIFFSFFIAKGSHPLKNNTVL